MLYFYNKCVVMSMTKKTKSFETKKSIRKGSKSEFGEKAGWKLRTDDEVYAWTTQMELVNLAREGISYDSLEVIAERLKVPVKAVLSLMNLPQTTYNKKKKEGAVLNSRNTELVLLIIELLDYGLEVFNEEEDKFQRWLKKSNISLGGYSPESMLDTASGISEVKHCLARIEHGIYA